MMKSIKWITRNMELLFWITGLVILFFLNTTTPQTSLCFFSLFGLGECPGCGIGHAIHEALHGHFASSFHQHIMGIPAVLIIFIRIKQLLYPPNYRYESKPC